MSEQLYNVVYSQESEGQYNPFVDPSRMKVQQVTEAELREMWDKSTHTQDVFGTFENYLAYTAEASDYLADTNWWDAEGIDTRTRAEAMSDEQDFARSLGQTNKDLDVQSDVNARQSGYQQWLMSDTNQALMSKYGVDPTITTDKGDKFTWTGSGYIRTVEPDEGLSPTDIGKLGIALALGWAGGGAVAGALSGTTTGTASAVATSISAATGGAIPVSTVGAVGGGIVGSAISQGLITGEVDPVKLVQAGLTAGILDVASIMSNMDPELVTNDYLYALDEKINGLADALEIDYDSALDIVTGVATGVVNGGDIENIAVNVASTYGSTKIADYIQDNVGTAIPNFFNEGTTEVNRDALKAVSREFLSDALTGKVDEGTLLDMGLGYYRNDGSFAFLDPGIKLPDLPVKDFDFDLFPDFDFELRGGTGFDIFAETPEFQAEFEQDVFGDYVDPEDKDTNIVFQYDQDFINQISSFLEDAKQAGRDFDDAVIQPVVDMAKEAGYFIDENILQPIKDTAQDIWDALPDVDVDFGFETPETPQIEKPEGVDIETPDFKLDDIAAAAGAGRAVMPRNTFYSGLSYQVPTIQDVIQSPEVDYTMPLNNIIDEAAGLLKRTA